ncbi:MAG: AtpZ/AtpI family protein [Flavobacteriaceae bacterium]|jgi:putative Ca2+/H+ antiporter (TMEM165/GDT1 family)|nr:AtpZ/AtpI family protein [Flavobacteriaceae bacterium]
MKKRPNSWLVFFSLAVQIGLTMFLAVKAGNYFDTKYSTSKPFFTLGMCLFALLAVIRLIVHQTKKL